MKNFEEELLNRLEAYEAQGAIDSAGRMRLTAHLQNEIEHRQKTNAGFYLIYGLGSLLVCLGIILAINYNWDFFPKGVRLAIALFPLALSALLGMFMIPKLRTSAWIHIVPALNIAGVICAIAVISQIYHIDGNLHAFLFGVLCLTVLIPIIFNSPLGLLATLSLFLMWAADFWRADDVEFFYIFFAPISLQLFYYYFKGSKNVLSLVCLFVFCVFAPFILAANIDKDLHGIDIFCAVLSMIYPCLLLLDTAFAKTLNLSERPKVFRLPLLLAGFLGILGVGISHIFSFRYYGEPKPFLTDSFNSYQNAAVLGILGLLFVCLFCKAVLAREKSWPMTALSAMGFVGILHVISIALQIPEMGFAIKTLSFCVLSVSAVLFIIRGIREESFVQMNAGTALILAQALAHFTDSDASILFRSGVFIALGLALMSLNLVVAKKKTATAKASQ